LRRAFAIWRKQAQPSEILALPDQLTEYYGQMVKDEIVRGKAVERLSP